MTLKSRFILFFLLFSVFSCLENDEKIPISASSMEWFFNGDVGDSFLMVNSDEIQESYTLQTNYGYKLDGSNYSNGLDVNLNDIDEYIQSFQSTYHTNYSMSVGANYIPFGDRFYFSLGEVSFAIDLGFGQLTEVTYKSIYYKSLGIGEQHYYQSDSDPLLSSIEYLNNFEIEGQNYIDVIHFTLNDFSEHYETYTIRHIYFAKHFGLIYYSLNNGLAYYRN